LSASAGTCIGVDIDQNAIIEAKRLSGLENIIWADVTDSSKPRELIDKVFDLAIFGEVLEHIGNPVLFLKQFLQRYGAQVAHTIITVPNALRAGNLRNAFKSQETINTDHRFFFTPYTICKVAWDAGLRPISIHMAFFSKASRAKRLLLNRFPLFAENIIYEGTGR
jgi:2-polyprenyl-3-methyl-5-hydroxy-6-metoxy-1,4-benzoquinol methylase